MHRRRVVELLSHLRRLPVSVKSSTALKLTLPVALVASVLGIHAFIQVQPASGVPASGHGPDSKAPTHVPFASGALRQAAEPDPSRESKDDHIEIAVQPESPSLASTEAMGRGWLAPSEEIRAKYEHLGQEDFEQAARAVAEAYKLDQQRILDERLERGLYLHYVGVPAGPEDLPPTTEDMPMGAFGQWVIPREDGLTETKTVIIPFGEYPEFEQLAQEHYWLSYWQRQRKRDAPFQPFQH